MEPKPGVRARQSSLSVRLSWGDACCKRYLSAQLRDSALSMRDGGQQGQYDPQQASRDLSLRYPLKERVCVVYQQTYHGLHDPQQRRRPRVVSKETLCSIAHSVISLLVPGPVQTRSATSYTAKAPATCVCGAAT